MEVCRKYTFFFFFTEKVTSKIQTGMENQNFIFCLLNRVSVRDFTRVVLIK